MPNEYRKFIEELEQLCNKHGVRVNYPNGLTLQKSEHDQFLIVELWIIKAIPNLPDRS
jgi:hypothetical protein